MEDDTKSVVKCFAGAILLVVIGTLVMPWLVNYANEYFSMVDKHFIERKNQREREAYKRFMDKRSD